jgi:hypothetical protein
MISAMAVRALEGCLIVWALAEAVVECLLIALGGYKRGLGRG